MSVVSRVEHAWNFVVSLACSTLCNNYTHRPIKTILLKAKKLLDLSLWSDAASQIFYSLGIGFGAIVSFASFTKNCDNVIRDRLDKVQQFTLLLNKLFITVHVIIE